MGNKGHELTVFIKDYIEDPYMRGVFHVSLTSVIWEMQIKGFY